MFFCVFPWTVFHLVVIAILFSACSKKKPRRRRPLQKPSIKSTRSNASIRNCSHSSLVQQHSNKRSPLSRSSVQKSNDLVNHKKDTNKKHIAHPMETPENPFCIPDEDYGEIAEPTESVKKRREAELEREKRDKIKKGFYQENSDEDDTLEPIKSLKQEQTEESTKKSFKKRRR